MIERGMSETDSEKVVSVSPRGQATIPKEFREDLGIDAPGRVKFVRREDGEVVVRPIRSVTDLRGILTGETDDEGRSATQMLRDERSGDEEDIEALRRRYADDREPDSD